jgi:pyridinium-3,5-biscarboxylic acid mononucleotide sulfurtransferase
MTTNIPGELKEKYHALLDLIRGMGSAVVAFSGGVDSGLIAAVAYQALGQRMLAVTVRSAVETTAGVEAAARLARQVGFAHRIVDFDDLAHPQFVANPPDRCYHCKLARFSTLLQLAQAEGYACVLEGSNADDKGDYRPGKRAVLELGVRSPLADLAFTKAEIRALAQHLELELWNRPSAPCLATRFPYGTPVTVQGLQQIARGEEFLQERGYDPVRVRHYGTLARLEVAPEQITRLAEEREAVTTFFQSLGFSHVAVDLIGYRSGSLNIGIA